MLSDRREDKISRVSLGTQVTKIIRDEILTGRLSPGERILQLEWADRLGVSRMPVRDAISQLITEGMLSQGDSGAAVVLSINPEDIRDGYELNNMISAFAARRAAQRISEEELTCLSQLHEKLGEALREGDLEEASRMNWDFHSQINKAASSPRVEAILRLLAPTIPHTAFEQLADWPEQAHRDHAKIIGALRDRDGDMAAKLVQQHIEAGSRGMLEQLADRLS